MGCLVQKLGSLAKIQNVSVWLCVFGALEPMWSYLPSKRLHNGPVCPKFSSNAADKRVHRKASCDRLVYTHSDDEGCLLSIIFH